ncbi:hypothetical protein [Streptomyces sp. SPB4]|nr:hypothetical protein [Streptomyces sp. SPB4]MDH6544830.1 hypothetical protein [Streptomyces sp. SPB4]
MGTWDIGPFDNATAADFGGDPRLRDVLEPPVPPQEEALFGI